MLLTHSECGSTSHPKGGGFTQGLQVGDLILSWATKGHHKASKGHLQTQHSFRVLCTLHGPEGTRVGKARRGKHHNLPFNFSSARAVLL